MNKNEIINSLDKYFLKEFSLDEDFIGHQVNSSNNQEINNVLISLDLTNKVLDEAIEKKVNLIIIHHPFFYGNKKELLSKSKWHIETYKKLIDNNIDVFVIHTNADFSNQKNIAYYQTKKLFDLNKVKLKNIKDGNLTKIVLAETSKNYTINNIEKLLNTKLKISSFNHNLDSKSKFNKFYFASGVGAGELVKMNIDSNSVFITGEVKWHEWIDSINRNNNLIEINHYSEEIFVDLIYDFLTEEFNKDIKLIKTKSYRYQTRKI